MTMRFMVVWCRAAHEDLARDWLESHDRSGVVEDVERIDRRLQREPGRAGQPVAASELDIDLRTMLADRIPSFPIELRRLRFGRCEAFFTVHDDDCAVRVWLVRSASDP